jgi:transposase
MPSPRRRYSREFKQEAVQLVTQHGLSLAEASRRLGIDASILRDWKQLFAPPAEAASPPPPPALEAEVVQLRAENERLRLEREILKKATVFFAKESP